MPEETALTSQRRRDAEHQPVKVEDLALGLPASAWKTVTWREGSAGQLTSRFARLRVRAAHRDAKLKESRPEEWFLVEWPEDEEQPTKYWLSTLPESLSLVDLVDAAKLRWRIEREYQDLKQEVGLGHYEGRGWRLPSPRHAVHRRLWLSDLRTGSLSPFRMARSPQTPGGCRFPAWTTQPCHRSDRSST